MSAGLYELTALMWDQPTSRPGCPETYIRHRQGDIVRLTDADARRLLAAGAVVEPGTREAAELEQARFAYQAALTQSPY